MKNPTSLLNMLALQEGNVDDATMKQIKAMMYIGQRPGKKYLTKAKRKRIRNLQKIARKKQRGNTKGQKNTKGVRHCVRT